MADGVGEADGTVDKEDLPVMADMVVRVDLMEEVILADTVKSEQTILVFT
jgi:hypothetical protein